jgi:ribosomal protein S18 acetylase RimI-like enzyme
MSEENSFASRLSWALPGERESPLTSNVSARLVRLDRVQPSDEPFLYQTFASTRADEMAITGWNAEQQDTFLRMQYEAQRRSYRMEMPDAEYSVIRCDEIAVGRLILNRTPEEIHVVDIALLPKFRGLGIGGTLMKAIMEEAARAGKTVGLHVERFNPALRWYQRLGFSEVSGGPIYLEMVWRSGSQASGGGKGKASESESDIGVSRAGEVCVDSSN